MGKHKNNESGFGVIEIIVVLVILVLIGVGGYSVSKHANKKTNPVASTAKTTSSYSGWKSYCDTAAKLCIKYPKSWPNTNESNPTIGTIQVFENTKATANIAYTNVTPAVASSFTTLDTSDPLSSAAVSPTITVDTTSPVDFYTSLLDNPSDGDKAYTVVGGYITGANDDIPSLFVINTAYATKLGLQAGQTTKVQLPLAITDTHQAGRVLVLGGGPISSSTYTATQAAAWFSSTDGKTALQILKSFSAH